MVYITTLRPVFHVPTHFIGAHCPLIPNDSITNSYAAREYTIGLFEDGSTAPAASTKSFNSRPVVHLKFFNYYPFTRGKQRVNYRSHKYANVTSQNCRELSHPTIIMYDVQDTNDVSTTNRLSSRLSFPHPRKEFLDWRELILGKEQIHLI